MPFTILSTRIDGLEQTEKRILTPFGILDVILRWSWPLHEQELHFEIEVTGDTEAWLPYAQTFAEFKQTVYDMMLEMAKRQLAEEILGDLEGLSAHMDKSQMKLRVSCGPKRTGEKISVKHA